MLHGIDIASYQSGLNLATVKGQIDFVVIKATEGTNYVNPHCDIHYQQAKKAGILRGVYHYAKSGNATAEANYFCKNCIGYKGDAIPVLDWEEKQSVAWVNEWVRVVRNAWGVSPIIYANPWRFNQGGVDKNCGRWLASYPAVAHPTFKMAESWNCPKADGLVCMWQFCSDGRLNGYNGNLDADLFYGDKKAWNAYAGVKTTPAKPKPSVPTPTPKPPTTKPDSSTKPSVDDIIIISKGDGSNPTKYKKIS